MKEAFQDIVLRLALWGLAASIAVLTLRSWPVRAALARLAAAWRGLTAFGRFAVCVFLLVGVIEADKTNGVNNLPPQQMMQSGGSFRTGFTGFSGIRPHVPSFLNPVSLVNPVRTTLAQSSFAERKAANWNVRGAWRDSFWLPFGEGWVFPHGSNHLSGVEVVACGQVWPTPFGVCDEQWQIDIRNCAKSFIGSTAYLELSDVPAQYGFSASPGMEDVYKCNLFVAHRALQSGLAVPAIHGRLWRAYPPLANEWGNRAFAIEGWACVDTGEFTQTGYVSSQPSGDDTPGHLGIVDFDGMGISAGMRNVNRNFNACGATTVLRRYNSEVSE